MESNQRKTQSKSLGRSWEIDSWSTGLVLCYYWSGLQQQQQYLQQGYKQRFHDYIQANNIEMPTVRIQSVHTITATYIKNRFVNELKNIMAAHDKMVNVTVNSTTFTPN